MPRMDWNTYFFEMTKLVSSRSHDEETKIGAVIVDRNNRIVSTGYNGFLAGLPDAKLPKKRPQKYYYMVHAEQNAIAYANTDLHGASIYVNGMPCNGCMKLIITSGIITIKYLIDTKINSVCKKEIAVNTKLCTWRNVKLLGYSFNTRTNSYEDIAFVNE